MDIKEFREMIFTLPKKKGFKYVFLASDEKFYYGNNQITIGKFNRKNKIIAFAEWQDLTFEPSRYCFLSMDCCNHFLK